MFEIFEFNLFFDRKVLNIIRTARQNIEKFHGHITILSLVKSYYYVQDCKELVKRSYNVRGTYSYCIFGAK